MTRRVAVTGIGTLTPAGRGTEMLWANIFSGVSCLRPIDPQRYFDPVNYTCQIAGQVPPFSEPDVLTQALITQTDRCAQMALIAAFDALVAAKLPLDFRSEDSPVPSKRVGLTLATVVAGWAYVEGEMQSLWTKGVSALRRYGLTAGFLSGPQGHLSILFGIEGRTRTFVSERASGANALIEGIKAIQRGDAEVVLAGGTEAPITPFVWAAYDSSNMLQSTSQSGDQRSRMFIGEGSTFLVLEELEHARSRDVPILAEIAGWSRGTDPYLLAEQPGKGLTQAVQASLTQADIQPDAVDLLFPGGPALKEEDAAEEAAIRNVFDRLLPVAVPKNIIGHLQGAAVATDVAIAVLALHRQMFPPYQDSLVHGVDIHDGEYATLPMKHALVLSAGLGGMHASFIVSKYDD